MVYLRFEIMIFYLHWRVPGMCQRIIISQQNHDISVVTWQGVTECALMLFEIMAALAGARHVPEKHYISQ